MEYKLIRKDINWIVRLCWWITGHDEFERRIKYLEDAYYADLREKNGSIFGDSRGVYVVRSHEMSKEKKEVIKSAFRLARNVQGILFRPPNPDESLADYYGYIHTSMVCAVSSAFKIYEKKHLFEVELSEEKTS